MKPIAYGLIFLLLLPQGVLYSEPAQKSSKNPPSAQQIQIPESIGFVRERFQGKKTPLVICLEEAHAEFDAETNIRHILERLQKNYDLQTVGVEASFTELNPIFLRAFPGKEIMEKTLNEFLKRGEISGVEMASILNENESRYLGLENQDLYDQDRQLFLEALENQPKLEERLGRIQAHLVNLKKTVYSEPFYQLDEKIEAFENSGMHLLPLLKELSDREDVKTSKSLPQIIKLIQILHSAEALDKEPIRPVAEKFVITMKTEIPNRMKDDRDGMKEFQSYVQAYNTESLPLASFIGYLARKASSLGIDLSPYEVLKPYFEEEQVLQSIQSWGFMDEMSTLIQSVKENDLKGNEPAQTLDKLYRYLKILNQTAGLKAERKNFLEFQSKRDAFQESHFWDFIESQMPTVKRPEEKVSLEELLGPAVAFYAKAFDRENVMYDRIKQMVKDSPNQMVAVSSGGFHTQGFADRLKEEGISYCVVTPAIEKISDPMIYLNAIQEKNLSYAKPVAAQAGMIAVRRILDISNRRFPEFNRAVGAEVYHRITEGAGPVISDWIRNIKQFQRLTEDEKQAFVLWILQVISDEERIPPVSDVAGFLEILQRSGRIRELIHYLGDLDAELRFRDEISILEQPRVMRGFQISLGKILSRYSVNPNKSVFAAIDESNMPETVEGMRALISELGPRGQLKIYIQNPKTKESFMKRLNVLLPEQRKEVLARIQWQLYKDLISEEEARRDVEKAKEKDLSYALLFSSPDKVPDVLIQEGAIPNAVFFDPASTRDFNWLAGEVLQIVPRMARMDREVQAPFLLEIEDLGFSQMERGKGKFIQFSLAVLVSHLIENREAYLAVAKAA